MMVVETLNQGEKKVVGLTTSRDLLRIVAAKLREGEEPNSIMKLQMGDFMTPISQVIFCRPEETVGMCRTIMAKLGIKCIPVLSKEGRVEGLITAKDMADFGLEAKDRGGKTSFLRDVSERVGLGSNTSMAEPPPYLQAQMAFDQTPLFMNVGVAELPHPFKTADGVGMNHRGKAVFLFRRAAIYDEDANTIIFTSHRILSCVRIWSTGLYIGSRVVGRCPFRVKSAASG